jgi:hypothetical protein
MNRFAILDRRGATIRFASALFLLGPASASASAQSTGTVTGQVSNAAASVFLEAAVVEAVGTGRSVLSDREGGYELTLPAGTATLTITYTGLERQTVTATVPAGGRVVRNVELSSGVYKMDPFTVSGPREGSAAAITRQREAPNVKNVVASDSFGNIADGNIGDFLQQMPGITAVYVGADVRSVNIRGIDGSLNSVTMDGDRVVSSQSANTGRTFEFEQASLNNIETIEVTKAPTPDMDADSIGGNVNIVSKSAFDRNQPRVFSYSIGGIMCADWVRTRDADDSRKLRTLLIGGAVLVLGGELIGHSGLCPLVKRIWTPSFSLVSAGMCVLMLAAFYYIVDMRGWRRWTFPFIVAGANSIALYLMSQLLKPWVASIWQRYLGKDILLIAGPEWESVLRYPAIGLTFWLVAWWMYRNKFFVRI